MNLRLWETWQERVWSRECVSYCFHRWVCNTQTTLSEDVIILCRLLCNLTLSSLLPLSFESCLRIPDFIPQSCAVPSVNLPVQWRDRRHEIMWAVMNIFQLEAFWRIGQRDTARRLFCHFLCSGFQTQIPVIKLLSTKPIQSVIGQQGLFGERAGSWAQHLTTCSFFFISPNRHALSLSPSLVRANQMNGWPSASSGPSASSCRCVLHRWLLPVETTCCQKSLNVHLKRNGSKDSKQMMKIWTTTTCWYGEMLPQVQNE